MIETAHTILRKFQKSDLEDLFEYSSQEGVGEMAGWRHLKTLEEATEVLIEYQGNNHVFAIELKKEKKVIGYLAVNEDSEEHRADTRELGFALNREYQQRGIMTEVVKSMLDYLLEQEIARIYACCFQYNIPSRKLIEACGFRFEQEGSFYSTSMDGTFSSYEYIFTKDMWQTNR